MQFRFNNRLTYLILVIFGGGYGLWLAISEFLDKVDFETVKLFSSSSVNLFKHLTIILFLILVIATREIKLSHHHQSSSSEQVLKFTWYTFLLTLLLFAGTIFLVNPRGLYDTIIFPQLTNNIRQTKVQNYLILETSPEIIILGSSRTLTLSPGYVEQVSGHPTYNFGISGTRIEDALLISLLIYDQQSESPPYVLIYEIFPEMRTEADYVAMMSPWEMLSYMDKEMRWLALETRFRELINIHQFIEALYVLQYSHQDFAPDSEWIILSNGLGIGRQKIDLQTALKTSMEEREEISPCDFHNFELGKEYLEDIISLAGRHDTAIIFYTSPILPEYYNDFLANGDCYQDLYRLMDYFQANYENFYYLDYTMPETIHGYTDARGFFDGQHMTEHNSNLLIEAMVY
jgi:hypothetical protein